VGRLTAGPTHAAAAPESLAGLIERVTFHNEDTGFAVLQVKVRGQRDLVTVVGSLASVSPGEWIHAQGRWVQDREFGRQFRRVADQHRPHHPPRASRSISAAAWSRASARSTRRSWSNASVHESSTSSSIPRPGWRRSTASVPKRRQRIKEAWAEQKVIREIMVFLHSHGVSTSRAVRIYKTYGERRHREGPCQPVHPGQGHPWHRLQDRRPDRAAGRHPGRFPGPGLRGLDHVLLEATGEGHCALPVATC
jgi:exodeoxyribonuclease V alpha subunit